MATPGLEPPAFRVPAMYLSQLGDRLPPCFVLGGSGEGCGDDSLGEKRGRQVVGERSAEARRHGATPPPRPSLRPRARPVLAGSAPGARRPEPGPEVPASGRRAL